MVDAADGVVALVAAAGDGLLTAKADDSKLTTTRLLAEARAVSSVCMGAAPSGLSFGDAVAGSCN